MLRQCSQPASACQFQLCDGQTWLATLPCLIPVTVTLHCLDLLNCSSSCDITHTH